MEWGIFSIRGIVPTASIIGMLFTFLVSIGVPVVLLIFVRIKTRARISTFFIGCGIFIGFALILEQILHGIVGLIAGTILQKNIFLYGLYGGLAAALFEETGRFIAMKFCMKKCLDKGNALMYGVGHGGAEAILIAGLTSINNLLTSIAINSSSKILVFLDPSVQEAAHTQLQALWLLPAYQFYLGGVERILAIALQICLSVFVYQAVKTGQKKYLAGAFLLHFIVDFLTVVTAGLGLPVWGVELVLLVVVVVVVNYAVKLYKADIS